MAKNNIFLIVAALVLILVSGCSEVSSLTKGLTGNSPSSSPQILKEANLGSEWRMTQMEITLENGGEVSVLVRLNNGDKVDGFFYLDKGTDVIFEITGNSLIYQSKAKDTQEGVTSDRFSFTASQTQGTTYTLTFSSPSDADKVKAFLEVIYPVARTLYIPVGK